MAPPEAAPPGTSKVKLTKKEKEAAEKELRRRMPPLSQISRNGLFEIAGPLAYTWAAGNVPGGPFVPVTIVCRAHNLYIFDGGEAGHRPSAKPRAFFQIKRAEVVSIGLLVIPPLPPHTNIFKISFMKKQFGHKSFFFKVCLARRITEVVCHQHHVPYSFRVAQANSNKELQRWMKDLEWRTQASDNEIKRRFEPDHSKQVVRLRADETDTAFSRPPERVMGMCVRYAVKEEAHEAPGVDEW